MPSFHEYHLFYSKHPAAHVRGFAALLNGILGFRFAPPPGFMLALASQAEDREQ